MLDSVSTILTGLLLLAQPPAAYDLELRDQYGTTRSVANLRGSPAVVMVVTARRLRTVKPWEEALQERYEDLATILIADVPAEPPPEYERVAAKLATRVPEGLPVLIDLEGAWARELELDTSQPNLLLLDDEGVLVSRIEGRWRSELGEEIFAAIERLLETE